MIDTELVDLDAAYVHGTRTLTVPRGDEHRAHVGDLSGLCDREVWARRKFSLSGDERLRPLDPDAGQCTAYWLGHAVEDACLERMELGLPEGWKLTLGGSFEMWLDDEDEIHSNFAFDLAAHLVDEPPYDAVVGHLDALLLTPSGRRIVVDIKSSVWFSENVGGRRVWTAPPPKESHCIQVAAYALAVRAEQAVLFELDLGGKQRRIYWVDPQEYREQVVRRMREVVTNTDPSSPEPPALPNPWTIQGSYSWACGATVDHVNRKTGERTVNVKRGYCANARCPAHVLNAAVTL